MLRVHEMSFVSSVNFSLNKNRGRGRGATTLFSHSGLWLWEEFFFFNFFFSSLAGNGAKFPGPWCCGAGSRHSLCRGLGCAGRAPQIKQGNHKLAKVCCQLCFVVARMCLCLWPYEWSS